MVHLPHKELMTYPKSSSTAAPLRPSPPAAPTSTSAHPTRLSRGPKTPLVDPPSSSIDWINFAQASMQDIATLGKDLLYAVMPQQDLHARRKDLEPDELLNYDFSSILDATSYFRLFAEHMKWLAENKFLEEELQSTKGYQKAAEDEATKEVKFAKRLKKQLQEKLTEIKEKNKALLDLQRKANKEEKRLLELQQEVSKIPKLETKVKELEGKVSSRDHTLATHDKALLVY
ncbi:hypothetical protein COCNU_11G005090 [Cocos nucifera]|uniref:Uncharacterized protein n=1 Tax=Cocos nucifera TaxID=13894 RepID=A0A8K0N9E3_COCNU|nr:hypothetical protein COCNU_11G005090 [Cocos nucifera]